MNSLLRKWFVILVLITLGCIAVLTPAQESARATSPSTDAKFTYVDIYVDSGQVPLAAYQVELRAAAGAIKIVGVEGGEPQEFKTPPHYDPAALQHERVILAAYSTAAAAELPVGRVRVARVHIMMEGEPPAACVVEPIAAGDCEGRTIPITTWLKEGVGS